MQGTAISNYPPEQISYSNRARLSGVNTHSFWSSGSYEVGFAPAIVVAAAKLIKSTRPITSS